MLDPATDERARVLATFEALRRALNGANAESFSDNLTDDFMLLDLAARGTPPVGRAAYRRRLEGLLQGATLTWDDCVTDEVVTADDLGFHRYSGVLSIVPKDGGGNGRHHRRYLDVFRRDPSGRWRLWQHVFITTSTDTP